MSLNLALVGNPNAGKSSLFNTLTNSQQQIGNWPGVTVEKKVGEYNYLGENYQVTDLPGCYTTVGFEGEGPNDERITQQYLKHTPPQLIVNVVDASQLARQLYLSVQLLEQGFNLVIALNMLDTAASQGITIDAQALSKALNCPVVPIQALKASSLLELKKTIQAQWQHSPEQSKLPIPYPKALLDEISNGPKALYASYLQALEGDSHSQNMLHKQNISWQIPKEKLSKSLGPLDLAISRARFALIDQICAEVKVSKILNSNRFDFDNFALNKWFGIPFFLSVMYSLFVFSIQVGGRIQEPLELLIKSLVYETLPQALNLVGANPFLKHLCIQGLGEGFITLIQFVPIITCMFLFLAFLESSGYMARAAFVVDRLMRAINLPGQSFVPLIVGFGCNVPAILGTRTLHFQRERILTILMAPFISCGARLTIYGVFVAAFFPKSGANIIFALYLFGIAMAVMTAFLLKKTLLAGNLSAMTLELPKYHLPSIKLILRQTWQRLNKFLIKAAYFIVPITLSISVLNYQKLDAPLIKMGKAVTPIFEPMGIKPDNWPATVGLVTGLLAKEVVVGTLNALYANDPSLAESDELSALSNTILVQRFGDSSAAIAYLIFVLLYFPCISVLAVIAKELNYPWACFTLFWTTGLAYTAAVIYYQACNWQSHPRYSMFWIVGLLSVWVLLWGIAKSWIKSTLINVPKPENIIPITLINND